MFWLNHELNKGKLSSDDIKFMEYLTYWCQINPARRSCIWPNSMKTLQFFHYSLFEFTERRVTMDYSLLFWFLFMKFAFNLDMTLCHTSFHKWQKFINLFTKTVLFFNKSISYDKVGGSAALGNGNIYRNTSFESLMKT